MIKGVDYYKKISLSDLESRFFSKSEEWNDVFADFCAVAILHNNKLKITQEWVTENVGKPSSISTSEGDLVLYIYKWMGLHGNNSYESETKLVFQNSILIEVG